MEKTKDRFNLELIISLTIVMVTVLGSTIPLYLHSESKSSAFQTVMYQEMKDFHGRLEKQDAEFKTGMLLIEEKIRNRG